MLQLQACNGVRRGYGHTVLGVVLQNWVCGGIQWVHIFLKMGQCLLFVVQTRDYCRLYTEGNLYNKSKTWTGALKKKKKSVAFFDDCAEAIKECNIDSYPCDCSSAPIVLTNLRVTESGRLGVFAGLASSDDSSSPCVLKFLAGTFV